MCQKNHSNRNLRHRYSSALRPTANIRETREPITAIRCDKATYVVNRDRLIAYCCK